MARAVGCDDDDEDMEDAADDAGGDADYGPTPREGDGNDYAAGEGNGTTDAGADTDAAEREGQHLCNSLCCSPWYWSIVGSAI